MGHGETMTKKTLYLTCCLILVLAAGCGPAPEPTLSSADLAGTAMADAWLAITQTQAAIPTNTATPIPPTPTFPPTFTPFPTLAPVVATNTPAAGDAAAANPCYDPPPAKPKGTQIQV